MPSTVDTVRAAVQRWCDRPIGVACSGGADSMALADAAIAGGDATIITIDHGLAAGSAERAEAVAAWARGQGARAVVRRIEVPKRASLEAAARDARYAALTALAAELGLAKVLLGHTARDQAETVLMRIVRGTGPAGLAGIPSERGIFARPLLELSRDTIDAYVAARGLPIWDDPMNTDERLARVRVRRHILPLLRGENPALDEALLRLAASAREWRDAIDELAAPFAKLPIDCAALAKQPAAIRKRAFAIALGDLDAVHLDALDALVIAPSRGEVCLDLPTGRIVRSYDTLDSPTRTPDAGCRTPDAGFEMRLWKPGDRMKPARLKGRSRKLSDLYIDAKIPREARRRARVLVRSKDNVIVWAEFLGAAFGEPDRSGWNF
jgi:tRNA(Ile)-lysidine synthase